MSNENTDGFADRLRAEVRRCGTPACVGLDPVIERMPREIADRADDPVSQIAAFCRGVLDACAGVVPVVKFQSACFERYGGGGVTLLDTLIGEARDAGFVTILDAKRGDIGVSARHYAVAALDGASGADSVTVSPYLGMDAIEPFLKPAKGVFVLVRTSNPGSDEIQSVRLRDGRTVAEMVGARVAAMGSTRMGACGFSDIGAVVGVTKAGDGQALRKVMPNQWFLAPGFGAQGGTVEDVRALCRDAGNGGGGVLVTASRSIIHAFVDHAGPWRRAVGDAAKRLGEQLAPLGG